MLCAGGVAAPMALLGAKGEVLFQKRTSPFETPKRKAGGVAGSLQVKHVVLALGAQPLLFGLSSPLF